MDKANIMDVTLNFEAPIIISSKLWIEERSSILTFSKKQF